MADGAGVLIAYPTPYTFKVMGLANGGGFPAHVRQLMTRFVGHVPEDSMRIRDSAKGKYQSISVTVVLLSEDQRRSIYEALHTDERVVYYL